MSWFYELTFCCHCFVPKNKLFHKPLTPQPVAIATTDIIRGKTEKTTPNPFNRKR